MASVRQVSTGSSASVSSCRSFKKAAPTTFGLELEFNLAFNQVELAAILEKYHIPHKEVHGGPSAKAFDDAQHRDLLFTKSDEPSHQCREQYPSWGIEMLSASNDAYLNESRKMLFPSVTSSSGRVRPYMAEHLLIAQNAIKRQYANAQVDICAFMRRGDDIPLPKAGSEDFLCCQSARLSHWTLTNDHTLIGSLKSQLLNAFPSKIGQHNVDKWDSAGVELISPVLQLSEQDEAINTLSNHLTALRNSQSHDILKSKWAGMHIHIGLNISKPEELDENILFFQHLAYILVSMEDLVSSCFPRKCSGLKPTQDKQQEQEQEHEQEQEPQSEVDLIMAQIGMLEHEPENETSEEKGIRNAHIAELDRKLQNLPDSAYEAEDPQAPQTEQEKELANERSVLAAEASYTGYGSINSNARYFASQLKTQHPVTQATLAQAILKPNHSFADLVNLLQPPLDKAKPQGERFRGHMYNFANLYNIYLGKEISETWKIPKPTIEFRQHECTVDAEEVAHWVKFTEAIVKKAAELAGSGSGAGSEAGAREEEQSYMDGEIAKYTEFPPKSMTSYCAWLRLDGKEQKYWQQRHEEHKDDRPVEV